MIGSMRYGSKLARTLFALGVAVAVVLVAFALEATQPSHAVIESVDAAAHDLVLSARPASSYLAPGGDPRNFITIVAIDERTIGELGAYNGGYPRAYHAQVIQRLL